MPDLTDRQLATLTRHLAHVYLEVERGHRSPDQLRDYLTPSAWMRLRAPDTPRHTQAGPVLSGDLGSVRLTRYDDHVHATIPTRLHDDRWGALTLGLRRRGDGRWQVTELEQVRQRTLDDQPPPASPDPRDRRRQVEEERTLVAAAYRATRRHRASLDADTPNRRRVATRLADLEATWRRRLDHLDRELDSFPARDHIRRAVR